MIHELKTVPPWFERIVEGEKTVEVRKDDRDFQTGDTLRLREWDPERNPVYRTGDGYHRYTGREVDVAVTHALRGFEGLADGWVALSITVVTGSRRMRTEDA
ncbi:DUF3850 domain-containing protein [Jiangella asiatica]|uniref:DUF3850 domain-containing protein n=1 Tax=Jiangella asiatica TaxID=2530372 RepID=A0A4R5CUW0_9ACTN|nr:DUF3850 domain-containing protein [Jiangella asiatica]TDE03437.1 DUF3850 domain-containing protein [Jiangella asiatica]